MNSFVNSISVIIGHVKKSICTTYSCNLTSTEDISLCKNFIKSFTNSNF